MCYAGFYSPSAYYPVRLNTQVETRGYAWKLQLTTLGAQHNSLTRVCTDVVHTHTYYTHFQLLSAQLHRCEFEYCIEFSLETKMVDVRRG